MLEPAAMPVRERRAALRVLSAVRLLEALGPEPQRAPEARALTTMHLRVRRVVVLVRLLEALGPEPQRAPADRVPMTMHLLEREPELVRAPEVDVADAGTATAIRAARLPTTSRLCCRRCRAATALR